MRASCRTDGYRVRVLPIDLSTLPPEVEYLSADAWGLTDAVAAARGLALQPDNRPELYVHHTAGGFPDQTSAGWDDDPVAWVQWLDRYAREVKGYKAPDYSWAIHRGRRGSVYVVTIIEVRGDHFPAATLDRNTLSKAIVFAGDYREASPLRPHRSPDPVELLAAQWLVTELRRTGRLAPDMIARPHRDNPAHPGATSCCGDELIPWVPWIATPYRPAVEFPPAPLAYGDRGPGVLLLSQHLRFWKVRTRGETSRFGRILQRDVRRMQARLGVKRTGRWDRATSAAYRAWVSK